MIPKKNRLSEREIRKIVRQRGVIFSANFVAHIVKKFSGANRYGIIFSGKHTKGSVNRNFFRRMFYREAGRFIGESRNADILFIPKKGSQFTHTDVRCVKDTRNDMKLLFQKIYRSEHPGNPSSTR